MAWLNASTVCSHSRLPLDKSSTSRAFSSAMPACARTARVNISAASSSGFLVSPSIATAPIVRDTATIGTPSQLDGAGKFLVGTIEVSKLEIGFRELIVGLRETGIDLHGIGKLDGRLAVLAPGEIALAALKILLFAHIGITRAAREQSSGERTDKQQADNPGTTHDHFSNCGAECADKLPALERSIILHENRQRKVTAVTVTAGHSGFRMHHY